MAAADLSLCSELLLEAELDSSKSDDGFKLEKQLSASQRRDYSLCRRKSFAAFVASRRDGGPEGGCPSWFCCGQTFRENPAVHKHVAKTHDVEIKKLTRAMYECSLSRLGEEAEARRGQTEAVDISAWIPDTSHISEGQLLKYWGPGKVVLYYHYCPVEDPHAVCAWQKALCEKLHLTGKIRVASEGINGTVGGTDVATDVYIDAMRLHPLFGMDREEFKTSDGGAECFTDLRVGVYKEIVPMGMDPDVLSYRLAGIHLDAEEFHREVEALLAEEDSSGDTVLLDCRNFYESKIGHFTQCLAPDIRKFSYFPDYVDQNLELFRDKKVLMYCTGGIRCERGSAYLRSKDVCKEVYQLKGGIHKYLERFPDGFYRGKLFVFDERYTISSNGDVISDCRYCGRPWDQYKLCSTQFCCQLVLSCHGCRRDGHTACCPACQNKGRARSEASPLSSSSSSSSSAIDAPHHKEECECTDRRPRIPQDVCATQML